MGLISRVSSRTYREKLSNYQLLLLRITSDDPKTPESNSLAQTPATDSPNSNKMTNVDAAATIPTEKTVEELKANVEKVVEEVVEEKVAEKRPAENGEEAKAEEPEAKKAKDAEEPAAEEAKIEETPAAGETKEEEKPAETEKTEEKKEVVEEKAAAAPEEKPVENGEEKKEE